MTWLWFHVGKAESQILQVGVPLIRSMTMTMEPSASPEMERLLSTGLRSKEPYDLE